MVTIVNLENAFVKDSRFGIDVTGFLDTTMKVEKDDNQFHSIADINRTRWFW